jgi:geranylgeranyl diphosphate synthase type II
VGESGSAPSLVLLIAEGLGHGLNVFDSALAVEFFHTASLIADDLPCMDNEEERRSKPSVHKVYGESIALLSSYSLICSAFERIYRNGAVMRDAEPPFCSFADRACVVAFEHATRCAGILGATGGQFLDLFPPLLVSTRSAKLFIKKQEPFLRCPLFLGGFLAVET